jgi:SAM-dependent methyltransferase
VRWRRGDELGLRERYPPPGTAWGDPGYMAAHRRFLCDMLDDQAMLERFAAGKRLPRDYGLGLDERVVEYPWLFAQRPAGLVLDAGSALNHGHVLDRLLPRLTGLHVVTQAPEPVAFTERGVSYVYADLRELPYRDGVFDLVVSLSTLEHVGMDNSRYGDLTPRADRPDLELRRALAELRRVTRPGGRLLVTVPYGRREDHGWFRQFGRDDVEALGPTELVVFGYSPRGWQRGTLASASAARYVTDPPAPDGAVAARAVACLTE